jgi:dTDP-4-amino-4,6-dideoxygalactose transaminase
MLIEEGSHALGAEYQGRRAGTRGLAGCFGFDPPGQGGLIVTADEELARAAQAAGDELGEVEAAILRIRLAYLGEWNARRRLAARRYADLLNGLPDLTLPVEPPGCRPTYQRYVARIGGGRRDAVQERLAVAGIETESPHPFKRGLPRAEAAAAELLALPMGPFLTLEEQDAVAAALRGALEG